MSEAGNTLTLETTQGPVVIEMNPPSRPAMSRTSRRLVGEGFYDGIVFHRVIEASWRRPAARTAPAPAARNIRT